MSPFATKLVGSAISAATVTVIVFVAAFPAVSNTEYVTVNVPTADVSTELTTALELFLITKIKSDVTSPSTLSSAVTPVKGLNVESMRIETSFAPEIAGLVVSTSGSSEATLNNSMLSNVIFEFAPVPNKNSIFVSTVEPE
jgi:hypothetical protein